MIKLNDIEMEFDKFPNGELTGNLLAVLRDLRLDNNLYLASFGQHYQKTWVRDSFYEALPELTRNTEHYKKTFQTLLDYYIKMEEKYNKFTWVIKEPHDKRGFRFPHPRLTCDLDEIREEWGFKQLDCFGEFLYGIWLGESQGINIIRDENDVRIISLMIDMLASLEYWKCEDNGIWEENEEVHASSVGACLAGLTAIKSLKKNDMKIFKVDQKLLDAAHYALNELLPGESITKSSDLALLTLIYPFNIVSPGIARQILTNVETELLRERGVLRYQKDTYYDNDKKEAEWCFGFTFLALAYNILGEKNKAKYYLNLAIERTVINDCKVPELFLAETNTYNQNTPLGWSNAMLILALDEIK